MSAKKRLQEIQQKLIPWHRHFYTLRGDQKPAPLPDGVLEELRAFVADFPESEKGLRELAGLEAGMGNTAGSIELVRRLVALPGQNKKRNQDRLWLAGLEKLLRDGPPEVLLRRSQVEALLTFVDERLRKDGCDHTLRFTFEWAERMELGDEPFRSTIATFGCYCDCEVVLNLPCETDLHVTT